MSVCHHDECPPFGCMKKPDRLIAEAIENGHLIAAQPPGTCEFCGKDAELRPYGPKGERICFACMMRGEDAAKVAFDRKVSGA